MKKIWAVAIIASLMLSYLPSVSASCTWSKPRPSFYTPYNEKIEAANADGRASVAVSAQIYEYVDSVSEQDYIYLRMGAAANTRVGITYCFWAGSPTANHIYYKKYISGTWDTSPTDWIDETEETLTGNDRLTCFYEAYGGKIGLLYMTRVFDPSIPYNVKYAVI